MLLSSVEGVVRDLEFLGYEMVNSSEYVGGGERAALWHPSIFE